MFETGAVTLMDRAELRADEFLDEHLQVTLDIGDADAEQTANRVLFSRKLHYVPNFAICERFGETYSSTE